jgi:hypothetical protein
VTKWLWEGSEEDIWTRIMEQNGEDITSTVITLQFRPDHVTPTADDPDWFVPSTIERYGSLVRTSKHIVGAKVGGKETKYRVWVKVTDGPANYVLLAGFFTVR